MRNFLAVALVAVLAACGQSMPPSDPPSPVPPPEVATDGLQTVYVEETIPLTLPKLRAFMREQPLIGFLEPTENISNPVASQVIEGTWDAPGAVRWLRLADGHYVIERVLQNEPDLFRYQVYVFTNDLGRGVEQIVGEQRFVPVEGGTQFQWTYSVKPKNALTALFVRRALPEVETYIGGGLKGFAAAAAAQ